MRSSFAHGRQIFPQPLACLLYFSLIRHYTWCWSIYSDKLSYMWELTCQYSVAFRWTSRIVLQKTLNFLNIVSGDRAGFLLILLSSFSKKGFFCDVSLNGKKKRNMWHHKLFTTAKLRRMLCQSIAESNSLSRN